MSYTFFPRIEDTFAIIPSPPVSLLSKFKESFTLYPSPRLRMLIFSIGPSVIDSITDFCLEISFVSIKKSLSAKGSDTLYGKVFLRRSEFPKSNSWFKDLFSSKVFVLYWSPIKYGNCGLPLLSMVAK